MKLLYIILALHTFSHTAFAQSGNLDSTFNGIGKATIDFPNSTGGIAWDAALQSDGKILIAGYVHIGSLEHFGVTRLNVDGTIDTTFGSNGRVVTSIGPSNSSANSVAVQSDGKIMVAGTAIGFELVRYHPDGIIDSTFGIDGLQTTTFDPYAYCTSMAIQPNGKILLAGHSASQNADFALVRFQSNGTIDSSFGTFGKVTTDIGFGANNGANAIAIQPDGKIVAGGLAHSYPVGDFCLIRYNVDGSLDSTFSMDGKVTTSISQFADNLWALVIQPDGKIIAAGYANNGDPNHTNYDFALARYNEDGLLDFSFGTEGIVITSLSTRNDQANSIIIQSDGKIIAAGYADIGDPNHSNYAFALARYHTDGTPDTSWGNYGVVTTTFGSGDAFGNSMVLQPDGKIVAIGSGLGDFAVTRYLSGLIIGTIELSTVQDVLFYPNPVHELETLEYNLEQDEIMTIALFDVSGQLCKVFVSQDNRSRGTHRETLWFGNHMIPGIYFLHISTSSGSMSIKIIKQ